MLTFARFVTLLKKLLNIISLTAFMVNVFEKKINTENAKLEVSKLIQNRRCFVENV